ncbi:MAG: hypothetical protein KC519_17390 [Anaerolineae bacterium]|nr:hypothetical protein [Anaerolineae bacterium]
MKSVSRIMMMLVAIVVLALPFSVASAQTNTRSVTWTEDQVNNSYRVTNPWRRSVTDVSVDLQAGQVVISSTQTYRRATYQVEAIYEPSISNGRIYWTLTSASANGEPASQDLINQINASISTSWRNYVRQQAGTGRVQGIVITDADITVTYSVGR